MGSPAQGAKVLRFGVFEVDLQAGELRKAGLRVKLQEQPLQLLAALLQRPGEVVTREDLRQKLWPVDTFVDFDHSLNSAVKKLRQALGDDPNNPRFIETIPRRGYRLIVAVNLPAEELLSTETGTAHSDRLPTPIVKGRYYRAALIGALLPIAVSFLILKLVPAHPFQPKVMGFLQITNDGQMKSGSLITDGSRIYTTEVLPGPHTVVVQVSPKGGETVPLPTVLRQPQAVDLSPDGTELLVLNNDGPQLPSLWIQPLAGGSPRRVGAVVAMDASWYPDGETIIYSSGHEIDRVKKGGTLSRKILSTPGLASEPRFSPDGRTLSFTVHDDQGGAGSIWEAAADGSGPHPLLPEWSKSGSDLGGGVWTQDGGYFIFQARRDGRTDVWAIREKNSLLGYEDRRPVQLTAGPISFSNPIPSRDGGKLFVIGLLDRSEVVRYDLGTGEFVPYFPVSAEGLAFSKDGEWVTYTDYPGGALWRSNVDGSEKLQLTFPPVRALLPRWSPDGKQIAYVGNAPGKPSKIYLVSAEGGIPQQLLPGDQSEGDPTWSPDGNSIAFGRSPWVESSSVDIQVVDLKTLQCSKVPGSEGLFSPRWSPDGRYLVALTLAKTIDKTPNFPMLFDFTTQKWEQLVNLDVSYPSWTEDGEYLYFQDWSTVRQDGNQRIIRLRLRNHKLERIVEFKDLRRVAVGTATWSGVAPDGSPLLARDVGSQEVYALQWRAP
jgi:Tol biopolymer transport system component/DNA-binding winged helix-turn-helix (wHTH) protein